MRLKSLGLILGLCAVLLAGMAPAMAEDDAESIAWDMVRDTADPAILDRFLERFPKGPHASEANDKLDALTGGGDLIAPPELMGNAPRTLASMNECDRQAADPYDIANPRGYPGLYIEYVDPRLAAPACRAAMAQSDDPRYQYLLARALFRSEDTRNHPEGRALLEKAVDQGYSAAYMFLANMLPPRPESKDGTFVGAPRSGPLFERWEKLVNDAADMGNPFALLARIETAGQRDWNIFDDSFRDPAVLKRAYDLLVPLADAGMPRAISVLGDTRQRLFDIRDPIEIESDYCPYLERGVDAGDLEYLELFFSYDFTSCLFNGPEWGQVRHDRWVSITNQLADEGNTSVMLVRSTIPQTIGAYATNDLSLTYKWTKRAADLGNRLGMESMMFDSLFGEPETEHRAPYIYALIEQGDAYAREYFRPGSERWPILEPSVAAVQQLLKQHGWYSGPIDGDFGPGTVAAINAAFGSNPPPLL